MNRKPEYITVGRLGRTRGVDGQIWITPLTDFPDRFLDLTEILVGTRNAWELMKIEAVKLVGGRPVAKFTGINSREEAARLTNRDLAVTVDRVVALAPGTHYVFDLIGCEVVAVDDARRLGEVTDVKRYPANDVYVVLTDDGREVLYPAVKDLVAEIDTERKRIIVRDTELFGDAHEKTAK